MTNTDAAAADAGTWTSGVDVLNTYEQVLTVKSRDGVAAPQPTCASVYDGKRWALSTRWDDSNPNALNIRRKMLESGIRGTFYLNSRKPESPANALACRLTAKGHCSVGGHTVSHPRLPEVPANVAFREILANRIILECLMDQPVNSFAFPYGAYRDKNRPEVKEAITRAFLRSGYHHCVYADFVNNNRYMPADAATTGVQVRPGDRVVDAQSFWAHLTKIRQSEAAQRKTSDCIFLGVHPWQEGEELQKLGAVMDQLRDWDDFWHCTQTEYAAFAKQRRRTTITPTGGGAFRITRPCAYDLGSDVPLTLVFDSDAIEQVRVDGQLCEFQVKSGKTVVNLPHAAAQGTPSRIDQTREGISDEFPGLTAALSFDRSSGKLSYELENAATGQLRDLVATVAVPPAFDPGVVRQRKDALEPGESWRCQAQAAQTRQTAYWQDGACYMVVQLDFLLDGKRCRLFTSAVAP